MATTSNKEKDKNKESNVDLDKESSVELTKPQNTSVKKKKETLIYCGPSYGHTRQFNAFVGGYPKSMESHFKKCNSLKSLFVSVKDFQQFKNKLNDKSSIEYAMYLQVDEYFKKEAK